LVRAKGVKRQLVSEYKLIKKEMEEQKTIEEEQRQQEMEAVKKEQALVSDNTPLSYN
jgi:hypothetical protein